MESLSIPFSIALSRDLSCTEKLIYGFLRDFENPTDEEIANLLGLSISAVSKSLASLTNVGLIKRLTKGPERKIKVFEPSEEEAEKMLHL